MTFLNMTSENPLTLSLSTRITGIMSILVIFGLLLFALPDYSEAQSYPKEPSAPQNVAPMNDGPQPPSPPGAPAQTPIDGGLGILLAAGGAYALRKMHKSKSE